MYIHTYLDVQVRIKVDYTVQKETRDKMANALHQQSE